MKNLLAIGGLASVPSLLTIRLVKTGSNLFVRTLQMYPGSEHAKNFSRRERMKEPDLRKKPFFV